MQLGLDSIPIAKLINATTLAWEHREATRKIRASISSVLATEEGLTKIKGTQELEDVLRAIPDAGVDLALAVGSAAWTNKKKRPVYQRCNEPASIH